MSDAAAVLFVNQAFYEAFRARDLATMDRLWSQAAPVACIHPGWHALTGREAVMESWSAILGSSESPDIHCSHPQAFVTGAAAFVICYERIGQATLVATNVFVREAETWRLVHHQAGPCNAPPEDEADAPDSETVQ